MANTEAKEMHNKDVLIQMWRPALAFTLAIGWIVGIAMGNEVPIAYQAVAAGGIAGLGVDRALWKRRDIHSQVQAGDPNATIDEVKTVV